MSSSVEVVRVELGDRSYEIAIGGGLLPQAAAWIAPWQACRPQAKAGRIALVITDTNAARHAEPVEHSLRAAGLKTGLMALPSGEPTKRLEIISGIYDRLVEMQADRRTLVVAVGGGVIGDAAGFAAATYARGLPFVQIPTTLLADVDSSVGGKVGINHPQAKNLIGAFHQPLGVIIDTDVLATLPEREFCSGLAEVVKYGVILDDQFFDTLEQQAGRIVAQDQQVLRQVIARSCQLKANVVEQDEHELSGLRAVLNYGHTFGHAFEALCGYGELLHGEAVAIGMVYASRLAEKLGRIPPQATARQIALLSALKLPVSLPLGTQLSIDDVIDRMRLDKKSVAGQLRFVLPTRIGHVELVEGVPESLVREVLAGDASIR